MRRGRVARTFVTVLSPAPLLFLALFLLGSPVTQLVLPEQAKVATAGARAGAPVVMVVFDEFPLTSLLGRDGRIDRVRYPSFATLAARSTWYSHAHDRVRLRRRTPCPRSSTGAAPARARCPRSPSTRATSSRSSAGPTASTSPRRRTYLCPRSLCPNAVQPALGRRLRSLALDSGVVYAHLVLPAALEDSLPSISEGWGDFHGGDAGRRGAQPAGRRRAPGALRGLGALDPAVVPAGAELQARAPAARARAQYLPDGHGYSRGGGRPPGLRARRRRRTRSSCASATSATCCRSGFTDRLLGRLIARLRETGLWDRALVVVTADHGVSFRVGQADGRSVTPENVEDIAPVPLFVKAPGQRAGRVSTRPVETIDILPTIADELGVRLPWRWTAARPRARRRPGAPRSTCSRGPGSRCASTPPSSSAACAPRVARKVGFFGSGSGDPGLYAVGPHRELLGRPVSALRAVGGGGASAAIDAASELADVDLRGELPALLSGRISGAGPGRHDLAFAVNGRVATVARSFPWEGR